MLLSLARIWRTLRHHRDVGFAFVVVVLVLSMLGNAATFYLFDGAANPDITVPDALWYSVVSITTIGYGDYSASTLGARLGTVLFVVLFGLAAFTSAIGIGIDRILERQQRERLGMTSVRATGHLLIVNPPTADRARKIIEEYVQDSGHLSDDVVVVSDKIESLPYRLPRVSFVRGSPLEEETYTRANLMHASSVMILGSGYDDPNSDSLVAAIVSVVEYLNPKIPGVAECQYLSHNVLFKGAKNIKPVFALNMVDKLMVQDLQDPGVQIILNIVTSNVIEGTLLSTVVEDEPANPMAYRQVAKILLDHDINLVGVIKDGIPHLSFVDLDMEHGDSMFYIAVRRREWSEIAPMLAR